MIGNMSKSLSKATTKQHNCIMKKCQNEIYILMKKQQEMIKKYPKDPLVILKIHKLEERKKLVECQLKQCQKEFKNLLKKIFDNPPLKLAKNDKNNKYYKFYHKYEGLLKKKVIEYNDVKTFDAEFLKLI